MYADVLERRVFRHLDLYRNGDGRIHCKRGVLQDWNLRWRDWHSVPLGQSASDGIYQLIRPAATTSRSLSIRRREESEVAEMNIVAASGSRKMVHCRIQSHQDEDRDRARIRDGCGADRPWICLTGHRVRSRNRS